MKVEIELPEIEGHEYTGEYRRVTAGDYFLEDENEAQIWVINHDSSRSFPILRKRETPADKAKAQGWTWPVRMPAYWRYFAMDEDGAWYAYTERPTIEQGECKGWRRNTGHCDRLTLRTNVCVAHYLLPDLPWEDSLLCRDDFVTEGE